MKALTVAQPWASLIVAGIKTLETRPAPPNGPMRPDRVRGLPGCPVERGERIAIHASARVPAEGMAVGPYMVESWWDDPPSRRCLVNHTPGSDWNHRRPLDLPTGAVIGTVEVVDALPILGEADELEVAWQRHIAPYRGSPAIWHGRHTSSPLEQWNVEDVTDESLLGDYTPGRWGWLLDNPEPLATPVPCKGRQGVWRLPAAVAAS